ncbi:putative permease, DMT superfamily [Sphaerochaeta pleomorpha str. Grapes]|uniref:Putative permease, DMT superfamily n=2 Tax=Sphaerochaeta TaxID=399320 RepID=G8QQW0_SPHPG|nr:putative permease, DMT superfamily [Sphaerochaeta pleomorpha str. Grapes]
MLSYEGMPFFLENTVLLCVDMLLFAIMYSNLIIGQFLALLTAGCWAQNSVTYRYLGEKVGSDAVAHIRMWIALPAIFLLAYMTEGTFFPLGLSMQTYIVLLLSGAIGYFITDMLVFYAFVWLGARESMIILTLSPVATAIFSYFLFGETLLPVQIFGILLTISGVILMVVLEMRHQKVCFEENSKAKAKGFAFAILGSVLQSIALILAKYALDSTGPVSTNLVRNVGGILTFIIYSFLIKKNAKQQFKAFTNPKLFSLLFIAALIGPVLGMSLQMKAFTLAPVGIVTTISQISPIILLPIDKFIFHKKLTLASIIGTFVSIGGVALLFLAA